MTYTPVEAGRDARTARVQLASQRDVPAIASTLADAFHNDRVFEWFMPDEPRRRASLPAFFTAFAATVGRTGELYATDGGAAIWVPPGVPAVPEADSDAFGEELAAIMGDDADRGFALMEVLEAHHPGTPHYYLPFVGVNRNAQGRGIGTELLRVVLDRCDADGIPAYLEATSADNRRLYERNGFVVGKPLSFDDSPELYPMWREPLH